MDTIDFLTKCYLHDSIITQINYNDLRKEITIFLDFCLWAQDDYNDDDPETIQIQLVFENVDNYRSDPISFEINRNAILSAEISPMSKHIRFVLANKFDVLIIEFNAHNVLIDNKLIKYMPSLPV